MPSGELTARHAATGQWTRLRWEDGVITELSPALAGEGEESWLAPVLVDLQVNGFGGIDFQRDGLAEADLLAAARKLRAAGCGKFLLTLVTDEWAGLTARLRHLRGLRNGCAELQSAIAGWHVEGPFLSAKPGFCGAHDPTWMLDPTPARIRELRELTGHDPLLLTLAPEREGALDAIRLAAALGCKVSLGHTDAPAETLRAAVAAGASGFTHLGNACPKELDRHDNILWRALETPGLTVSLIPDGIHVSPAFFRLVHRVLDSGSICHTTDAMAAAGAPPGAYSIGRLRFEVGADQIVREPGKTNFAGSALRPIDGVMRAARMLGAPWQTIWPHFSTQPARFMGLEYGLAVGREATFCLVKPREVADELDVRMVVDGAWVGPVEGA